MIGYLSPEGKFYECKSYEHLDLAVEICEDVYSHFEPNRIACEEYLIANNWIVIRARDVFNNQEGFITSKQLEFINSYFDELVVPECRKDSLNEMLLWDNDLKITGDNIKLREFKEENYGSN